MKKVLSLSIFLLLQLSLFAQQDSVLAQQYYEQADTTKNLDTKLTLLQKSLDAGYKALFIYEQMGFVYENMEKFDLAIEHYKKSLELVEKDYHKSVINTLIAGVYIKKDDYSSAKEYCEAALDYHNPYSLAYFNRGLIHQNNFNYSSAIFYFKKYIYYNAFKAYYRLIICYENIGDYNNSLYYAEKLLEEDPEFSFGKEAKLRGLVHAGKKEEILLALKKWYPASPEKGVYSFFEFYDLHGDMAFNAEGYRLARKYYKCVLGEFFQNKDVFYETVDADSFSYVIEMKIAQCYTLEGKYDEAKTIFEKHKKNHSSDHYLWHLWASYYMEKNDYKNAIKLFKKSLKIKPDYMESIEACAQSYSRLGDRQKAVETYTDAIDLFPENAAFFNNRAGEYIELKELDKAYHDIHRAMDLEPESVVFMTTLGEYHFAKEEFDEAIETMNEVLKAPEHTSATDLYAYYTRGKAYASRHNGGLAIADFEAVLEIDPNFAPALQELGIAIKRKGDYCKAKPHLERAILKKDKFRDYDFTRAQKTLDQIKDKNCRD